MNGEHTPAVLLLVQNSSYPGDQRVHHEATALTEHGFQVSVIAANSQANTRPWHEVIDGVCVYRFPQRSWGSGKLAYTLEYAYSMVALFALSWLVLLREGFDVVHAANPPDMLVFIGAFYRLFGKRFIFDHHDLVPEMYTARFGNRGIMRKLLLRFERISCRVADHVIATNESYKALDILRSGVSAEKITVVRNGPDLKSFRHAAIDPELRARAPHLIVYAGIMGVQDGVGHLLHAIHHLVFELGRTDFLCVLMGNGDTVAGLRLLARELRIEPYLWFAGFVRQPRYANYLATADICVCPDPPNEYTDRSTMVKVMEYMAVARPIVAFPLTETRFSAQDAAVYAADEQDFARALASLMDDPARRRRMGEFGLRRVETALAWNYSVAPLLAAYDKALGRPSTVQAEHPASEPSARNSRSVRLA